MAKEYLSKSGMQSILTKLKDLFDAKADASDIPSKTSDLEDDTSWTGTKAEWEALDKTSLKDGIKVNIKDDYNTRLTKIDTILSTTSENPVQNKVITTELNSYKDDYTTLSSTVSSEKERVDVIVDALKGCVYKEVTDASASQSKDVATNSASGLVYTDGVQEYADMTMLGGMSRKGKNLLNPTLQTTTTNGVTCTNNGDGTYTLNGTATAETTFNIVGTNISFTNGTYKACGCPSGGSSSTYYVRCGNYGSSASAQNDYGSGVTITIADGLLLFRLMVASGATVSNIIFKPMITTDTSLTYSDYEPYTSSLIDAPVDKVTSVGKNLLPYPFTNSTGTYGNVVITDNGDGTLTLNGTCSSTNYFRLSENADEWFTSTKNANGGFTDNGYTISSASNINIAYNSTSHILAFTPIVGNTYNNSKICFMLEKGSTATDYSAYRAPIEKSIPSTITDLCPDYGIGVNEECYNYIDVENKVYHHKVGSVDLGTFDWYVNTSNGRKTSKTEISNIKLPSGSNIKATILCSIYDVDSFDSIYGAANDKVIGFAYNSKCVQILDTYYNDASAFKTAMSGVILYYELATEETVGLSSVIDDDFSLLQVEGGGTLDFHYPKYDDGYVVDVPSSVTYDVDISNFIK